MICTLTAKQQEQFYIKIVTDLETAIVKGNAFTVKSYAKSIYDKVIANKKGSPESALQYVALLPKFILAAEGLNPETIGVLLDAEHSTTLKLLVSFNNDFQNVIDYVAEPKVNPAVLTKIVEKTPTVGSNVPAIPITPDLQSAIDEEAEFNPMVLNFFSTTGRQSPIVNGRETNVPDPNKTLTYLVLNKVLTQLNDAGDDVKMGSDLQYYKHKGLKLRLVNETQLPESGREAGKIADANDLVYVITDNNGDFLRFDNDGFVSNSNEGKFAYYSFRAPSAKNWNERTELIEEILERRTVSLSRQVRTAEELDALIARERKALLQKRAQEFALANKLNDAYTKNPNGKLMIDFTGGSKGYVNPDWTDSANVNISSEEFNTLSFTTAGGSSIKLNNVSKRIAIRGLGLTEMPVEVIDNLANVLASQDVKSADKINYLGSFVNIKSKSNTRIVRDEQTDETFLEINGVAFDLNTTKADVLKQALLETDPTGVKDVYFNVKKDKTYTDIKVAEDGKVTKKDDVDFHNLLKAYTRVSAKPNDEGNIVQLNGYFILNYVPEITEEKKAENKTESKKRTKPGRNNWDEVELEATNLIELKTTPEQQAKADQWWENSEISKIKVDGKVLVPLQRLQHIANSKAFATWGISGIKLNAGSDSTHIYHEAWHAFSQLFLTKNEKDKLYAETSDQDGTFKVVSRVRDENGNIVPKLVDVAFRDASAKQLEEYIAESYRKFAIAKGDTKGLKGQMKSVFKRIWEFIKSFFKGVTIQDTANEPKLIKPLNDMFNALYNGEIHSYSPSVENVSFTVLNAGIISIANINDELNHTDTTKVIKSIDGLLSQLLAEKSFDESTNTHTGNFSVRGLTNNNNKIRLYKEIQERISLRKIELLRDKKEANIGNNKDIDLSLTPEQEKELEDNFEYLSPKKASDKVLNMADVQTINNNIRLLEWTIANFSDDIATTVNDFTDKSGSQGVVAYHMLNSEFADLLKLSVKDELDIDDTSQEALEKTQRIGGRGNNETSSLDDADNQTIYIVKSLLKQDKEGNLELNSLGFPDLVNFIPTWNKLRRQIGGHMNTDVLYNTMLEIGKKDFLLEQLTNKLGNPEKANKEQGKLWMKFVHDFNRPIQKIIVQNIEMTTNNFGEEVVTIKIGRASADFFKVKSKWQTEFKTASIASHPYILTNSDKENYLNLPKIASTFLNKSVNWNDTKTVGFEKFSVKDGQEIKFLNAVGFFLSESEETRNELRTYLSTLKGDPISYIADYIGQLNNADAIIKNPIDFFSKPDQEGKKILYKKANPEVPVLSSSVIFAQGGFINRIAEIEASNSDEYSSFSRLTAEGKTQNEEALPSTESKIVYGLQKAKNFNDFSNPDSAYAYMSFLAKQNNPWARQSRIIKSLYNQKGERNNTGITIINLGGLSVLTNTEQTGVSKAAMSPRDKLVSDFNELIISGNIEHLRPGSKNSFFATKVDDISTYTGKQQKNLYIDSFEFIPEEDGTYRGDDLAFDILLPYVQAEMERMNMFYANEALYKKNKNFSAKTTGDFSLFAGILEEDTKAALKEIRTKLTGDNTLSELLDEVKDGKALKEKVKEEIKYYFDALNDSHARLINETGYIYPQISETVVKYMTGIRGMVADKTYLENKEFVKKANDAAIKSFTYNHFISGVETSILYYGDPTTYNHEKEEAHKRFSVFQSGGPGFPTDMVTRNIVNSIGTPLTKLKTGSDKDYTGKLKTAVIEDNFNLRKHVYDNLHDLFITRLRAKGLTGEKLDIEMYGSELNDKGDLTIGSKEAPLGGKMLPYFKITTTDGQGYISFDSYRQLKYAEGKWPDQQEDLYQRIIKDEHPSLDEIGEMFPVYKLQMAGHLKTPLGQLPVMSAHKFSLFPLIYDVVKGGPLEQLHTEMMEKGFDYVVHESGSKLSHITSDTSEKGKPNADHIFDTKTGQFIKDKLTENIVYAEYLKNQVEINSEFKGNTIFSTQLRVMLTSGLINEGLPIDFKASLSEGDRKLQWDKLTTEQREAESPYQKLINNYDNLVNRLTELTKEDLMSKIDGWHKNAAGRYEGPHSTMVEFVKNELKQQGLTEHEVDYIDVDGQGNLVRDVSGSPIADRIEKMLMAIVNNKVVKQTVTGEPLVEVSVANTLQFKDIDEAREKYGDEDLAFYEADVNGEKVTKSCQGKIALQGSFVNLFNLKDNEGNDIAQYDTEEIEVDGVKRPKYTLNFEASRVRLNQLIRNEEWLNRDNNRKKLRLTGVRIPVQGLNSMEFIEIAEFLPPSAGPIIILPAEIVAKSGTDFDVDKLTTYMPTISKLGNWLSDTFKTKDDVQAEIDKVSKQLETALKGKVTTTTTDITKVVKELIKNYRAGKGERGKQLAELRLKRDVLNTQITNNVADIKTFIRESGIKVTLYSALSKFMKSADNTAAMDVIKTFTNKPSVLTSKAISKTYDDLVKASEVFTDIKKELKEGYKEKDAYLDVDPQIKELTQRYDELKDQKRNFIAYVQNSLIDSIIGILELPTNAERLLTANDTHKTKVYADEMEPFVQDQDYKKSRRKSGTSVKKGVSPTTVFEYGYNFKKHQDNFVGKDSLAITAVANKGNISFNNAGAHLPATTIFEVPELHKDKDGIERSRTVEKEVPVRIYLNVKTSPFVENGKLIKAISLSGIYDSMNEDEISEIMSQLMNGMVDVEKDAWVAFIQGNREVTPIILFLLETGVPFKDIVYYVNNPLIRTYINQLKNNKGILGTTIPKSVTRDGRVIYDDPRFAKPNAIKTVLSLLGRTGKVPSMYKISEDMNKEYGDTHFTTERLKEIAQYDFKKGVAGNKVSLQDQDVRAGFLHFLYIEELAKNANEIRTATNFDTKKSSNLQEVFNRQELVEQIYESTKMPRKIIQYYLENSPTSGFKTTELVNDMFGFLFKFRNNEVLQSFTASVLNDYAIMQTIKNVTGLEKETFPTRFKNALTLYLFVNNLKSFSIGESTHYKGMPVTYVSGNTKSIEVKEEKTAYGPSQLVININENLLSREFKNKMFVQGAEGQGAYSKQGLATVKPTVFYKEDAKPNEISIGEREYYDFTIEREYLRAIKPLSKVKDMVWFKKEYARLVGKSHSEKGLENIIYERYLRNSALENAYNFNAMFYDNASNTIAYARKLDTLLKKYPNLENQYSVLAQLSPNTYNGEGVRGQNNAFKNLINISLKDASDLTPESTKQYHDDLVALADPNVNKTVDNTPEAIEDNELLSDMFRRFPMYIFMQGGMNKNEFSFNSILPYDDKSSPYSTIMNDALVRTSDSLKWIKYTDEKKVPEDALRKVDKSGKYYSEAGLLRGVLNKFIKGNNVKNKKANQRQSSRDFVEAKVLPGLLKGTKRKTIINETNQYKDEIRRLTYTAKELVYTLDTTGITNNQMTNLAKYFQGEAYFITSNPIFKDSSIVLKTGSIAEIDDSIDTMVDALADGIALVFNETGYSSPDNVLQDHITTKLFEKLGVVNTPMESIIQTQTEPEVKPIRPAPDKVVSGDIFAMSGIPVITTNLGGVHGAGLAQLAKAKGLIKQGDGNFKATDNVVQLPVKKVWSDSMAMNDNMELLKSSLRSLIQTARENPLETYLLPLAGLGHGEGSVEDILPLLIKTVQAAENIKLVLPGENVDLGRKGTVRKDTTREKMPVIKQMLEASGLISPSVVLDKATSLLAYRGKSGGANQSDAEWDIEGLPYGVTFDHYLLPEDGPVADKRLVTRGILPVSAEEFRIEGQQKVTIAARQMGRIEPSHQVRNAKLIRNWAQVKNADAVFAITSLLRTGDTMKYNKKALIIQGKGGTGYAIQMAINEGKPVYVFNQTDNKWYKNIDNKWTASKTPILTKNFAGIGTSTDLTEAGKQAIRDVYQETFNTLANAEQTFKC